MNDSSTHGHARLTHARPIHGPVPLARACTGAVVDWDGVDGAQLAKIAVENPSKASKVLLLLLPLLTSA